MPIRKELKLITRTFIIPVAILSLLLGIVSIYKYFKSNDNEKPLPKIKSFGIHLPSNYQVHGIDVSKYQGTIDWKRVSSMRSNNTEITFVFIKATEGITRQDARFKYNWKEAGKNNFVKGAYHFFYPSRDASLQAINFINTVKLNPGDLPPVIDIELSNGKPTAEIQKKLQVMLDKLEKHYKVKPIIYTGIHFYNKHLIDKFNDYPLWIAGYFDHDRFHNKFETPWIFWQHSEKGKVDGIRGNVDFNVFVGNKAKLKNLVIK